MQEENANDNDARKGRTFFKLGSLGSLLSDKEQKSLLFYISIGIILVEFAVTVGALIYGIANAHQQPNGMMRFSFPWAGYLVSVVVAPVVVMLLVHLIGMGFFRAVHGDPVLDEEQMKEMPERMRSLFSLVRGAPTIVLLGGIIVLGAVLYYLDGVMTFLLKLGDSVETIAIWGTVGLVVAWCVSYLARAWFMYKTRRLEEEFAFRREVFERTGMVILDQKAMLSSELPRQGGLRELPAGTVEVLPAGTASPPVSPVSPVSPASPAFPGTPEGTIVPPADESAGGVDTGAARETTNGNTVAAGVTVMDAEVVDALIVESGAAGSPGVDEAQRVQNEDDKGMSAKRPASGGGSSARSDD